MPCVNVSTINTKRTDYTKKTTSGRNIQNRGVAFLENATNFACYPSIYDLLNDMPTILRAFVTSVWFTMFLFTSFCIRSFGIRSFATCGLLFMISCLRTSGIRYLMLRTFLTVFKSTFFCHIWSFSYDCSLQASDIRSFSLRTFPYELLLTVLWRTIFYLHDHCLTNICSRT